MLDKLHSVARQRIAPFLKEVLNNYQEKIHSIYITGTAITDDFDPKGSDVNSLFVLKNMDIQFLKMLAPLGKKYGKNRIAAPLIMTPEYIKTSLDVFPIEFLNFKLIHATVFGEDILKDIEINRMDLRQQTERELKVKLIWLRQSYISSAGDGKALTQNLVNSISGYIPLFRGIIVLLGKEPPIKWADVIRALNEASGINTDTFAKVLQGKHEKIRLPVEGLNAIFEDYYSVVERLGKIIDAIKE